jgi:hypothetical protein
MPGIAATCDIDECKLHYYGSLRMSGGCAPWCGWRLESHWNRKPAALFFAIWNGR